MTYFFLLQLVKALSNITKHNCLLDMRAEHDLQGQNLQQWTLSFYIFKQNSTHGYDVWSVLKATDQHLKNLTANQLGNNHSPHTTPNISQSTCRL